MSDVPVVFCCYADEDRHFVDDLYKLLKSFCDKGHLEFIFDRKDISVGADWVVWAHETIDRCHYALLWISPGFQNSSQIKTIELPRIVSRGIGATSGSGLTVVPIFVSPSVFGDAHPLTYQGPSGKHVPFSVGTGFREQGNTPDWTLLNSKGEGIAKYPTTLKHIAMKILGWKAPLPPPSPVPLVPSSVTTSESPTTLIAVLSDPVEQILDRIVGINTQSAQTAVYDYWIKRCSGPVEVRLAAYLTWRRANQQPIMPDDKTIDAIEKQAQQHWTVRGRSTLQTPPKNAVYWNYPDNWEERVRWCRWANEQLGGNPWSKFSLQFIYMKTLVQRQVSSWPVNEVDQNIRDTITALNDNNLQFAKNSGLEADALHTVAIRMFQHLTEITGRIDLAEPWAQWSYELEEKTPFIRPTIHSLTALLEISRLTRDVSQVDDYRNRLMPLLRTLETSDDFDDLKAVRNAWHIIIESLGNEGRFDEQLTLLDRAEYVTTKLAGHSKATLTNQVVSLNNRVLKAQALHGTGKLDEALAEYDCLWSDATKFRKQARSVADDSALSAAVWEQMVAVEGQIRIGIELNDHHIVEVVGQRRLSKASAPEPGSQLPRHISDGIPALLQGMMAEWRRQDEQARTHYAQACKDLENDRNYYGLASSLYTLATFRLDPGSNTIDLESLLTQVDSVCSTEFRREGMRLGLSVARELIKRGQLQHADQCLTTVGKGWNTSETPLGSVDALKWSYLIANAELAYSRKAFGEAQTILKPLVEYFDNSEWPEHPVVCAEAYQLAGNIARGLYQYTEALEQFELAAAIAATANEPNIAVHCHRAASEIYRTTLDPNPAMAYLHANSAVVIALDTLAALGNSNETAAHDDWRLKVATARYTLAHALAELEAPAAYDRQIGLIIDECVRVGDKPAGRGLYGQTLLAKAMHNYHHEIIGAHRLRDANKSTRRSKQDTQRLVEGLIGDMQIGFRECGAVGDYDHVARALPVWARLITSGLECHVQSTPIGDIAALKKQWNEYLSMIEGAALQDGELLVHLAVTAAIIHQSVGNLNEATDYLQRAKDEAQVKSPGQRELTSFIADAAFFLDSGE